jgi:endoglucanase
MKNSIWYTLFIGIAFLIVGWGCSNSNQDQGGNENNPVEFETFTIHRGINVAHWLSQSDRRGEERNSFFTEEDVIFLAEAGFDHLRIPIDEEQMWDEAGNREQEAFRLLDSALTWSRRHGLRAIVDLHILRSHHFNEAEKPLWTDTAAQEKFYQLWQDLSAALKDYPTGMLAYELMNEPVADDPELWNDLVAKATTELRKLEPERIVVIGSNRWQSVNTFDQLKIPGNDQNILLSFHFYEPFLLTHYQASWTNIKDYDGPIQYPGLIVPQEVMEGLEPEIKKKIQYNIQVYNKDTLENSFSQPLNKAQQTGLPLYCGEFGVVETAPREDRLRWYQDMVQLFDEHDIAYANWNYKSNNFGIKNMEGEVDQTLLDILLGKKVNL